MGKSILIVLVYAVLGGGAGTVFGGFPKGTLIGAAVGALVGVLALRSRAAREQELRDVAERLGFLYVGAEAWSELPPFTLLANRLPGNPGLLHFIRGERDGATVYFCDSHLGINSSAMLYRPVVILAAPDLDLPHFVAHPGFRGPGVMYNVKLGVRIELPGNPKTHATGETAAAANVLTPDVLDYLARDPEWFVEGMGCWLIAMRWVDTLVWRFPGYVRQLPADDVPAYIEEAQALFRLFRKRRAA